MPARPPQIIAMGGGSFMVEPQHPRLERYILAQSGKRLPKVAFIPTATGDADSYIARFYAAFSRLDCRPSHIPLFARTSDLRKAILSQDVIYVGGGNTKSMLAVWREWGIPEILREAWRSGIVLAGTSAGAICWFEEGVTDSWADRLAPLNCLGFLPGACCPHFDGEAERRPAVHRLVSAREVGATLALDDGAAAHFLGRKRLHVVTSRPKARGYEVRLRAGRVTESALEAFPLTRAGELSRARR